MDDMRRRLACLAFVAGATLPFFQARSASSYQITDLGTLGGSSSYATAINGAGQVVGYSNGDAFLYSDGSMLNLTEEFLAPSGNWMAGASGINDQGKIAISVYNGSGGPRGAAIYWNGTVTMIPDMGMGYSAAINNNDEVIGTLLVGTPSPTKAVISEGTAGFSHLAGTGDFDYGAAYGINDSGIVIGSVLSGSPAAYRAYLHNGSAYVDLGTLGGTTSAAFGINNAGQVVGSSSIAGSDATHAFLYSGGIMTDINPSGGEAAAYDINNLGQIVGDNEHGAFLFSDGVLFDLSTLIPVDSGWTLTRAVAINDSGQIVGNGINTEGQTHAFLLTPVPEPATVILLTVASGLLLLKRRNRIR